MLELDYTHVKAFFMNTIDKRHTRGRSVNAG